MIVTEGKISYEYFLGASSKSPIANIGIKFGINSRIEKSTAVYNSLVFLGIKICCARSLNSIKIVNRCKNILRMSFNVPSNRICVESNYCYIILSKNCFSNI